MVDKRQRQVIEVVSLGPCPILFRESPAALLFACFVGGRQWRKVLRHVSVQVSPTRRGVSSPAVLSFALFVQESSPLLLHVSDKTLEQVCIEVSPIMPSFMVICVPVYRVCCWAIFS